MRNDRFALGESTGEWQGAPDVSLKSWNLRRSFGEINTLCGLHLDGGNCAMVEEVVVEVCECEDGSRALESSHKTFFVICIGLGHLNPLGVQGFRFVAREVPRNTSHFPGGSLEKRATTPLP